MPMEAAMNAAVLIDSGSFWIERRARELIRHRGRIGQAFAYWICADYCATKNGSTIRLFHAPFSNSRVDKCRLVAQIHSRGGEAYADIMDAIERDCANIRSHAGPGQ